MLSSYLFSFVQNIVFHQCLHRIPCPAQGVDHLHVYFIISSHV